MYRSPPPELWKMIFRFAVHVEPAIGSVFFSPQEHTLSIRTKKALRLVCSSWNELARETMFEQVHLWSVGKLVELVRVLEISKANSTGRPALGWWVRDIQLYFVILAGIAPVRMLERLIDCCPNISTFSNCSRNYTDVPMTPTIFSSLSRVASRSLKQAEFWSWDRDLPSMEGLSGLLDSCMALNRLSLGLVKSSAHHSTLKSKSLRALHFAPRMQHLATANREFLPNLTHLTMLVSPQCDPVVRYHSFLTVRGRDLTSIDCRAVHADISYALDLCPNLQNLEFTLPAMPLRPVSLHKSLRRIGIRGFMSPGLDIYPTEGGLFDRLDECLVHLQALIGGRFPALRLVWIPDGERQWIEDSEFVEECWTRPTGRRWSIQELRYWFAPQWRIWSEILRSENIDLQDWSGFPINFRNHCQNLPVATRSG